jgi:lysine-specific demethylase 8
MNPRFQYEQEKMLVNNPERKVAKSGYTPSVERMSIAMLERFWPEFYTKNVPVVVTGAMEGWAALGKWTPAYFARLLHGMEHALRESDNEGEYTFVNHQKRVMSVSDYLVALESEQLAGTTRPYFGNIPINSPNIAGWFDPIRGDFRFPEVAPERVGDEVRLWIGGKGQKSTIHNDSNHGFNAQVYGRKMFRLYPPEQYPFLYSVRISDETWVSQVDWESPDLAAHPEFAQANGMSVVLEEGEMLYIPAFWWHSARAESVAINLNIWIFTPDIGKWIQ